MITTALTFMALSFFFLVFAVMCKVVKFVFRFEVMTALLLILFLIYMA